MLSRFQMTSIRPQPRNRNDFRIAIICALPLEAGMVQSILDKDWADEGLDFGQSEGDQNAYTIGVLGKHNVVLAYMPDMGSNNAAAVAAGLRSSFHRIDVAFVVGVCGVTPKHPVTNEEIVLGDCILSTTAIQYDFGRQYPGLFKRKTDIEDTLGRASTSVRASLARLQTEPNLKRLASRLQHHLAALQQELSNLQYPGCETDRLFETSYLHEHHNGTTCERCDTDVGVCKQDCLTLKCDYSKLVKRDRLHNDGKSNLVIHPRVYFGRYGSANAVMKSGEHRERLVKGDEIVAFEMEGAGVWDNLPTIIIKSACDYADSHKNKAWQRYAAATAAAGLKSVLEQWRVVDVVNEHAQHAMQNYAGVSNSGTNAGIQAGVVHGGIYYDGGNHKQAEAVDATHTGLSTNESVYQADQLIRSYYYSGDRLLIKRLSGQELDLEKCYINLALVDRSMQTKEKGKGERAEGKKEKNPFSLTTRLRLDASEIGQSISLENIFSTRKSADGKTINPRRIFIQGRAGIGKTTLCKKIVYEFLEGRLGSTLFNRLIWVPLRGLRSNEDKYGWRELLQDTFMTKGDEWKDLEEAYSKQFYDRKFLDKSLFLFDGLDELSSRLKEGGPLYHFVNTIVRDIRNVIITSRPQANTFSLERFDLDMETVGFTTEQVSTYIKNCVQDTATITKMERAIAHRPLVRGLLRIPIQLDAFCYTWAEEDLSDTMTTETSTTMTMLYQSITTALCWKDLKRIKQLDQQSRPPSARIEKELSSELALLSQIAFQGLLNGVAEFNPQLWDKLGSYLYKSDTSSPIVFSSTLSELSFLRTSDHGKDPTKQTYHFIHLTFQEFFAARHFAEHWQRNKHDKSLSCLQLTTRNELESKAPFTFLQEEKYNSRYNIFWRFVAGLLSDSHAVVDFFVQLHAEPVDLLGSTHRRLLMYCLNEVACNGNQELENLCSREADLLRQGLLQEYRLAESTSLGSEVEFPETVLREFLNDEDGLPYTRTLSIIEERPVLGLQTVEIVSHKLSTDLELDVQLRTARVLWKHFTVCSQQIRQRAFVTLVALLKARNSSVQRSAAIVLRNQSSLSAAAVNTLIALLEDKDEDHSVRRNAARALREQSSLSAAAVNTLIALLEDKGEDHSVRRNAAEALRGQSSLSEAAVSALIAALNDEDLIVGRYAALALRGQSSLSEAAVSALIAALNDDEASYVRRCAAMALGRQSSLSEAAVSALIAALNDDEASDVRGHAARALEGQSSLSEAAVSALIAALNDDEDSDVRRNAAEALGGQSSLSAAAVNTLIALLEDKGEDHSVRRNAAEALRGQSSLSEAAMSALIAALNDDEDSYVRGYATPALSEAAIDVIASMSERNDTVQEILCQQPYFYSLISCLNSQAWRNLWAFWLQSGVRSDVSCYELSGALYVWSDGIRHKIFDDQAQIDRFRKAVLSSSENLVEDSVTATSCTVVKMEESLSATSTPVLRPKSKMMSKIKFWKK